MSATLHSDLISHLEHAAFRAWPAAEVLDFGGWKLRNMSGLTRRANSVWPNAESAAKPNFEARIDSVEREYRSRNIRCRFQLGPLSPPGLDTALERRGYLFEAPVSLQTARCSELIVSAEVRAEVEDTLTDEWLELGGRRGRFGAQLPVFLGLLQRLGSRAGFALARQNGEALATGLAVHDGDWVGVFSMVTLSHARHRGLGRALLSGIAQWAQARNAGQLYLQVERDNIAATQLYSRVGFREVYRYHYRMIGTED